MGTLERDENEGLVPKELGRLASFMKLEKIDIQAVLYYALSFVSSELDGLSSLSRGTSNFKLNIEEAHLAWWNPTLIISEPNGTSHNQASLTC